MEEHRDDMGVTLSDVLALIWDDRRRAFMNSSQVHKVPHDVLVVARNLGFNAGPKFIEADPAQKPDVFTKLSENIASYQHGRYPTSDSDGLGF